MSRHTFISCALVRFVILLVKVARSSIGGSWDGGVDWAGNLANFMHKIALFINSTGLIPEQGLSSLPPHFNHCSYSCERPEGPSVDNAHGLHMSGMSRQCNWYCCPLRRVDRVWWLEPSIRYRARSTIILPRPNLEAKALYSNNNNYFSKLWWFLSVLPPRL